jgi:hypothetical protein
MPSVPISAHHTAPLYLPSLPSSRARAAHYPSIQSSHYLLHNTALHSTPLCYYYCPCLSFPDPTIVHYLPPSPRLNTSLILSLHLSSHSVLEPSGHPSIRHDCFASRLIFVVHHITSHSSSLLESGTQPHLYINFLSLPDETAIHAISQSGRHRRSKPSPGTLRCIA